MAFNVTWQAPASGAQVGTDTAVTFRWSGAPTSIYALRIWNIDQGREAAYMSLTGTQTSVTVPANMVVTPGPFSAHASLLSPADQSNLLYFTYTAPQPVERPIVTSPSPGAIYYSNATLNVSWQFRPVGGSQRGYEVRYRSIISGARQYSVLNENSSATSVSISLGDFDMMGYAQNTVEVVVRTLNMANQWSLTSDYMTIQVRSTVPDTPVPTSPVNNANIYPAQAVTVSFPFTAKGGYGPGNVYFRYRLVGQSAWTSLSYGTGGSMPVSFTIAGGRFAVGQYEWQVAVSNTLGQLSGYSTARVLNVLDSVPSAPTLNNPANSSTQYNHQPITYTWTHNSNVGLPQAGFRLQWRFVGAANWTLVELSTAQASHTINHGDVTGTIEWRVATRNQYNEWSPYSAQNAYFLSEPLPSVATIAPTGGYVDPSIAQVFTWSYTHPLSLPESGAELAYRLEDADTWTVRAVTTPGTETVPANTLPVGRVLWRVRARDNANRWSPWAEAILILTEDVEPDAPTLIAPIGVFVPVSSGIYFTWRHNSPIGTPQGGAELRYRVDGGSYTTVPVIGDAQTQLLAPFTIPPGVVGWQARTRNRANVYGVWAAEVVFNVTGAPVTPNILAAGARGSVPYLRWAASGQVVYAVELRNAAGDLIDTVERPATFDTGEYTAPMHLPNGTYTLRVRVKNQYNYWSPWVTATIVIDAPTRPAPDIAVMPLLYGIRVDIPGVDWQVASHAIIYRDGAPIGRVPGARYDDYRASGNVPHRYFVRLVYADGTFADSDIKYATLPMVHAVISLSSVPSAVLPVELNRDQPPMLSGSGSRDGALIPIAGRDLPAVEFGEQRSRSYSVDLALIGLSNPGDLGEAYRLGEPVLLRDLYGRAAWCRVSNMSESSALSRVDAKARTVGLILDEVLFDETVPVL